jgi:HNH endonuclease
LTCIKKLFKGLYKTCECGCNTLIPILNRYGRPLRFKYCHSNRGKNHPMWKGGRIKEDGYWYLWMPNYFSSNKNGYIQEHIYNYQEYNKLCMLPWGEVHHINFNKDNNEISNLQGMTKSQHTYIHMKGNEYRRGKHIDTSDRICYICKSSITKMRQPNGTNRTPYPRWQHLPSDKINWYCADCYYRRKRSNKG